MLETALVAFTTFFATVGPLDVAAAFAGLSAGMKPKDRRRQAIKGVALATTILLVFAIFGDAVLALFGVSLPALRIAGGILLLLIAIDMVFARDSGGTGMTQRENQDLIGKQDIAVVPLATPLLAGPGAIGAVILLSAEAEGDGLMQLVVIGALLAVMALGLVLMFAATAVQKALGVTGLHVVGRVIGVMLTALAVQFILDGLQASNLIPS